jgi:hypothetical protein
VLDKAGILIFPVLGNILTSSWREDEMEENQRQKIGNVLYALPLFLLGAFLLVLGFRKELPSNRFIGAVFFVSIMTSACSSLMTNDIGLRGVVVNRFKQPKLFWFQFILMTVAALACLCITITG